MDKSCRSQPCRFPDSRGIGDGAERLVGRLGIGTQALALRAMDDARPALPRQGDLER